MTDRPAVSAVLAVIDAQIAGCAMLHPESCPDCASLNQARAAVAQMAADLAAAREERDAAWRKSAESFDAMMTACRERDALRIKLEAPTREAVTAKWNRRDAAPALLAEVELVRSGLRNRGEYIEGQPPLPLALVAYDHMKRRAEAAEQVAREAHELLRAVAAGLSVIPNLGPKTRAVLNQSIAHLAHHGARTGESG